MSEITTFYGIPKCEEFCHENKLKTILPDDYIQPNQPQIIIFIICNLYLIVEYVFKLEPQIISKNDFKIVICTK